MGKEGKRGYERGVDMIGGGREMEKRRGRREEKMRRGEKRGNGCKEKHGNRNL